VRVYYPESRSLAFPLSTAGRREVIGEVGLLAVNSGLHDHLLHFWFSSRLRDGFHKSCIVRRHLKHSQIGYNARGMTPDRIAALLSPFLDGALLSASQLSQVSAYTDLLMKWNAHINLTAVRDPEEVITRHFGESLFAARNLFPAAATGQTAIDLGSGAGFPGLPLKIWNPELALTLIEANQRKAVFLREVVRALSLSEVTVVADRAESVSEQASLVILRAVERFEKTIPVARRLVAPAGRIALLIGDPQIQSAKSALADVRWEDSLPLPLSRSRRLLIGHAG
jgi:16S rRNA (guanine527-N7)-methyltransferase